MSIAMTMTDDFKADRRELANVLTMPYDTVEYLYRAGRLSYANWRLYQTLWDWSAARFSGRANIRQSVYAERLGWDAVARRIQRTSALIQRLLRVYQGQTPWPVHVTEPPTTAGSIAYGYADNVQVFSDYEQARPSIVAFAKQLAAEFGKPGMPAMICIDHNNEFYVSLTLSGFSAMVLFPDYLRDEHGEFFYDGSIRARNINEAGKIARDRAKASADDSDDIDPNDFRLVLLIPGNHEATFFEP